MMEMASQITSLAIVCSIIYSDADQRKHQSSASLAFVRGIHRGPVNSPHKWPVTRKCFNLMTSSCIRCLTVIKLLGVHIIFREMALLQKVCLCVLVLGPTMALVTHGSSVLNSRASTSKDGAQKKLTQREYTTNIRKIIGNRVEKSEFD